VESKEAVAAIDKIIPFQPDAGVVAEDGGGEVINGVKEGGAQISSISSLR